MTEFRKKNYEKYFQQEDYSAKKNTYDKDESIFSPICISENDINDNVASNNGKDCPQPKGTIWITSDSIISGLQPGLQFQKIKLK